MTIHRQQLFLSRLGGLFIWTALLIDLLPSSCSIGKLHFRHSLDDILKRQARSCPMLQSTEFSTWTSSTLLEMNLIVYQDFFDSSFFATLRISS